MNKTKKKTKTSLDKQLSRSKLLNIKGGDDTHVYNGYRVDVSGLVGFK